MSDEPTARVTIRPNGPVTISGDLLVTEPDGHERTATIVSVCRCQLSANLPYCDGSHKGQTFE